MRRSEQDDCGQHRHEDRRYGHHQEGVAAEACLCLFSGVLRLALSAANGIDDSDLHNGQNRRRDQNGIRHPGEVRGNEGAVYEPHHAERRTAVHGDHEELGRIGMVDQIEYRENGQDHIKRLDRSDADVADCAHADRHDNACDQQIASADNAAGEPFLRPVRSMPSMTRPPTTPMMPMASRILVTMRPIMNVLP